MQNAVTDATQEILVELHLVMFASCVLQQKDWFKCKSTSISCVVTVTWKNLFVKKMELLREHFRAIIFHNFWGGLSRQECIDELKSMFGDKPPCYSTMKNWFNEFNCGRRSLKDEVREDPPKTAAVRELIMPDCHVTYRAIDAFLGISATSIQSILHQYLAVNKDLCSLAPTIDWWK